MNLTEFLLARIAEDEAAARRVDGMHFAELLPAAQVFGMRGLMMPAARVLAECEAKRRIVEGEVAWDTSEVHDHPSDPDHNDVLRLLALPYSDHPDYRSEWAP